MTRLQTLTTAFATPLIQHQSFNIFNYCNQSFCSAFVMGGRENTRYVTSRGGRGGRGGRGSKDRGRGGRRRFNPQSAQDSTPRPDPFSGPRVIKRPAPPSLPSNSVAVVWFRNDLRIKDNEVLALANTASVVVPVFVFDKSKFGVSNKSPWGFQRTGPFRTVFMIECIEDLQNSLRSRQSDMVVRIGDPATELLDIVKTLVDKDMGPVNVIAQKEVTWEEVEDERRLQDGLRSISEATGKEVKAHWLWGSTLHHLDDLPFNPGGPAVPDTFTAYRKMIESNHGPEVRKEVEVPEQFKPFPLMLIRSDNLPSPRQDLRVQGLAAPHDYPFPCHLAVMDFIGGETKGLERIKEYIWETYSLASYKETRNESGKKNCSSKFSSWLTFGCISPRTIYWNCKKFEDEVEANESTYWMIFELMTRDYFRWVGTSVGTKLFAWNGYSGRGRDEKSIFNIDPASVKPVHMDRLEAWMEGMTGSPLIDANMRELAATGYMSNRGRQNVASFLIHDLEFPDWRAGAEYFESLLIDHDVTANWANWAYLAGVGSDPRGGRKFNIAKQSLQYEPDGWYLKRWCPELREIPEPMVHEPYLLTTYELQDMDVELGKNYPKPIVRMSRAPPTRSPKN